MMVGVGRKRGAGPLTDLGEISAAVGAAPEIDASDNQNIGVGGIDPDDIAIPSLLTEVLRAGVAKGVRDAAIGRNVNLSFVAIGRSINNGWIRWSVGEFDATGGGKARGGTPGHSTISGIQ